MGNSMGMHPSSKLVACVLSCLISTGSVASGAEREADAPLVSFPSIGDRDIFFGLWATTDYLNRGMSNSNGKPAVQGYIEPTLGLGYVDVFFSNVDYGEGFRGAEIDVSGGLKRWDQDDEKIWFDVGYLHYFYSPSTVSPDYGEMFAKVRYNNVFSFGFEVDYAPDYLQGGYSATYVQGDVAIELVPGSLQGNGSAANVSALDLFGSVGYQFFDDPNFVDYSTWAGGVEMKFFTRKESTAFTLLAGYSDTDLSGDECLANIGLINACDARVFATLKFDSGLSDWLAAASSP